MMKSRILIVEDEQLVARTVEKQLTRAGYDIPATTSTGEEAIQLVAELRPDLVLMDIKLSGKMDGVAAAEHIRTHFDIPVIYLTAYTDDKTIKRAKITEPFGYVVKPFSDKELCSTIEMALYKYELEQKLRESEARYRALSELTSDFAYSVHIEPNGALRGEWATEAFTQVVALDINGTEVPGDWRKVIYPADLPKVLRHTQKVIFGEKDTAEFRIISREGDVLWVRNYARPEWDEGKNRVVRIIGAAQDITEQKRAEDKIRRERDFAESLIETAQVIILVLDKEGRIVRFNPYLEEISGYRLAEARGKDWFDTFLPPCDHDKIRELFTTAVSDIQTRGNVNPIMTKNGRERQIEWYDKTLKDEHGAFVGLLAVGQDVTARLHAAQALRQSEFEKSLILGTVTDMVAFYESRELEIVWTNKASVDSVGLTTEDLIGHHCYEIWHHRAAPCVGCPVLKAFESGEYQEAEMITPDNRFWELRAYPATDEKGHLIGVVEIGHNITARKRAEAAREEQRELLRQVLDINPNYIFVRNREGNFTLVNRATAAVYGMTEQEMIGKNLRELHPDLAEAEKFLRGDQQVMDTLQELLIPEEKVTYRSGEKHWHRIVKRPIVDKEGAANQVLVVTMDITARREAEDALRQKTEELTRTAADLQSFAYIISHDLQEPLRMITCFLNLLKEQLEGHFDAEAEEYIYYAIDGAERMKSMIDGILAYSRVETRGKELTPTASEVVLERVLRSLKFMIAEGNAEVTYDPLPTVRADAVQLTQLFQNLISNAIKFRKEDELPQVHIAAIPIGAGEASEWRFSVRDNGIGIDAKQADRVFIMFQRLHTAEEYEGSGIGLAICKRIVERHGGKIWVESQPGEGATFYFTLPAE